MRLKNLSCSDPGSNVACHRRVRAPRTLPARRRGSPSTTPTAAPPTSPSAAAAKQPDDQKQQYRADGRIDDRTDQAGAEMDPELRQQPAADKGAQDADNQIADDPKAGATNDLTGQPACHETYKQNHQQALTRHIHLVTSIAGSNGALICSIWSTSVSISCGNRLGSAPSLICRRSPISSQIAALQARSI